MNRSLCVVAGSVWCVSAAATASVGSLVAYGDEWVFADLSFSQSNAATSQLAANVATAFTGGEAGRFLNFSNNQFAYGDALTGAFADNGVSFESAGAGFTFTADSLLEYDAVFLGGAAGSGAANAAVLTDYIQQGGHVFVVAGTGDLGSAGAEANAWNPLLNQFGLEFGSTWFGFGTAGVLLDIPIIDNGSQLSQNQDSILWGFGQTVSVLDGAPDSARVELIGTFAVEGQQSIAASSNFVIPTPGTLAAVPLAMLVASRRRR